MIEFLSCGLLNLSVWQIVLATLLLTHLTIAAVTIYLHRHQAHRALDLHPVVSHVMRFWLWFSTGIVTKEWVSIHRKHHARVETVEDPHSPVIYGIQKVLWDGFDLYDREKSNVETMQRFSQGTPDDWLERHVYSAHAFAGIAALLLLDIVLFGVLGLTVWAVQMMWIPFFAAGVINGLGHYWGYRNFEPADASTNISPLGILIGGEEMHNNHHAFPSSAKLSYRRWEFDIGWVYIRVLSALGLARIKRTIPKPYVDPEKSTVDLETIKALIANRLLVMSNYGRDVLKPVLLSELERMHDKQRQALGKVKSLMFRETSLLDEDANKRLTNALAMSERLHLVYQFRLRLQAVWRDSHSNAELIKSLQDWCHQAERSGIEALQEFALMLRGYRLEPVRAC